MTRFGWVWTGTEPIKPITAPVGCAGRLRRDYEGLIAAAPKGELSLEVGIGRAAIILIGRIAGLGHEAINDPMELKPVIEAFAGQPLYPRDMGRRHIGAQLDNNPPLGTVDDQQIFCRDGLPSGGGLRGIEGDQG
jgi:hypothetical protein